MKKIDIDWEKGSNFNLLTTDYIRKNWNGILEEIKVNDLCEEVMNN